MTMPLSVPSIISQAWPISPKPVISVQAFTGYEAVHPAAMRFRLDMEATTRRTVSSSAMSALMAVDMIPVPEDGLEDGDIHRADRQADDVERQLRDSPHGIYVREGVGNRDLAKGVSLVHDVGEEVQGQDQGELVIQPVYPGVIGAFHSHDEVGITHHGQGVQQLVQDPRTDFAGSTGPVHAAGQFDLGGVLCHGDVLICG